MLLQNAPVHLSTLDQIRAKVMVSVIVAQGQLALTVHNVLLTTFKQIKAVLVIKFELNVCSQQTSVSWHNSIDRPILLSQYIILLLHKLMFLLVCVLVKEHSCFILFFPQYII